MSTRPSALLSELGDVALRAGRMAQEVRNRLNSERALIRTENRTADPQGALGELKNDGSIVTAADREVETMLRQVLPTLVNGTCVAGEEFGYEAPGPNGLWVVDPVDGTSNFAYGSPFWAVSIGLVRNGQPGLGAVFVPDLNELFLGEIGGGAYLNGRPLARLEAGPIISQDLISYSENVIKIIGIANIPGKMRCVGAAVIDGAWVASGRYRGLIGCRERLHDIAATIVLNTELGAEIRYLDGDQLVLEDISDGEPIGRPWIMFPPESRFGLD